jgi:hypothetical protein
MVQSMTFRTNHMLGINQIRLGRKVCQSQAVRKFMELERKKDVQLVWKWKWSWNWNWKFDQRKKDVLQCSHPPSAEPGENARLPALPCYAYKLDTAIPFCVCAGARHNRNTEGPMKLFVMCFPRLVRRCYQYACTRTPGVLNFDTQCWRQWQGVYNTLYYLPFRTVSRLILKQATGGCFRLLSPIDKMNVLTHIFRCLVCACMCIHALVHLERGSLQRS